MKNKQLKRTRSLLGNSKVNLNEDTSLAKKTKPQNQREMVYNVEVNNKFQLLEADQEVQTSSTNAVSTEITTKKSTKPKPIVVHGLPKNHVQYTNDVKDVVKNKFHLKYLGDKVKIFTEDLEDFNNLKESLVKKGTQFHTYSLSSEKKMMAVLKGVQRMNEAEVLDAIKIVNPKVVSVKLLNKTNLYYPKFKVAFESDVTFNEIQSIRGVSGIKVYWEKYKARKGVTQCYRCQKFGHAANNCNLKIACRRCAGNHLSTECLSPDGTNPKCANCGDTHQADFRECSVYLKANSKTVKQTRKIVTSPTYVVREEDFPSLRPRRSIPNFTPTLSQVLQQNHHVAHQSEVLQQTRNQVIQRPVNRVIPPSAGQDGIENLNSLFSEIKKLESMCNIDKMLKAVRELNRVMATTIDGGARMSAFIKCAKEFDG